MGWALDALSTLALTIERGAGRSGKVPGKLRRAAKLLARSRESRPEYGTIALEANFSPPAEFASLDLHRRAVCTVLTRVVAAVEQEMGAAGGDPTFALKRGRVSGEAHDWAIEDSPFIKDVNDVLNQLEDIDI